MLYVIHGTDSAKVADQATKLVAGLQAKRPDAQVYTFEGGDFDVAALDALVEQRGLFVEKHIVVLKMPFETPEGREWVLARAERFAASENIFVVREGALHAAHKKALAAHAQRMEEHVRAERAQRGFDPFGLVRALKAGDRRALWLAYAAAERAAESAEATCGLLHWGVRDMLKNSGNAGRFTHDRLVALSRSLIALYHDAHRGKHDLAIALERWILAL